MTGQEVRATRRKMGLTQQELADRVGVARNTVARWEMGVMGVRESAARLLKRLATEFKEEKRRGKN